MGPDFYKGLKIAYKSKKGWYKLRHPEKFIKPIDNYMQSFNESENTILFKSSLEYKAFRFCDSFDKIIKWSVEAFPIKYVKPTDKKIHRYYPDLYIEFATEKFLVEIKSNSELKPPDKPKNNSLKSSNNYKKAIQTWLINQAKWSAAKKFCKDKGLKFIFLSEEQLK